MDSMNGKKNSICRYYAADGNCFYGDDCQFIHSRPPRNIGHDIGNHSTVDRMGYNSVNNSYYNDQQMPAHLSSLNIDSPSNNRQMLANTMTNTPTVQVPISSSIMQQQLVGSSYFVMDDLRSEVIRKLSLSQEPANPDLYPDLPLQVDHFNELITLDKPPMPSPSTTFGRGLVTSVYRATNMKTGELVCLRRIHAFQPNTANTKSLMNTIDSWKKISHPNLVVLKQVFTTKAFGDNSLVFVYEYFEGAETLMYQHFPNHSNSSNSSSSINGFSNSSRPYSQQQKPQRKLLPEALLWNYIIQLSSVLRTIHSSGLAYRAFDPTKILMTGGHFNTPVQQQSHQYPRLRLNCCGIFDVITHDNFLASNNPKAVTSHFQQEDLSGLGKICLALACNHLNAVQRENLSQSLELINRSYSSDMRTLILYLLNPNSGNSRSINDIMPMIGARFYTHLETMYQRDDMLTNEVAKEIDNGRLFRLLTKLGVVNERPEFHLDPNWSEIGDRYLLKLFRDYLFHQNNEDGHPWIDLGHVVGTLNKLDLGTPEKICLVSRDEQNIIIVSFAELKRCLESSVNELL